jgi:hypothetical protein
MSSVLGAYFEEKERLEQECQVAYDKWQEALFRLSQHSLRMTYGVTEKGIKFILDGVEES